MIGYKNKKTTYKQVSINPTIYQEVKIGKDEINGLLICIADSNPNASIKKTPKVIIEVIYKKK